MLALARSRPCLSLRADACPIGPTHGPISGPTWSDVPPPCHPLAKKSRTRKKNKRLRKREASHRKPKGRDMRGKEVKEKLKEVNTVLLGHLDDFCFVTTVNAWSTSTRRIRPFLSMCVQSRYPNFNSPLANAPHASSRCERSWHDHTPSVVWMCVGVLLPLEYGMAVDERQTSTSSQHPSTPFPPWLSPMGQQQASARRGARPAHVGPLRSKT
jgi:hypothetical protein